MASRTVPCSRPLTLVSIFLATPLSMTSLNMCAIASEGELGLEGRPFRTLTHGMRHQPPETNLSASLLGVSSPTSLTTNGHVRAIDNPTPLIRRFFAPLLASRRTDPLG